MVSVSVAACLTAAKGEGVGAGTPAGAPGAPVKGVGVGEAVCPWPAGFAGSGCGGGLGKKYCTAKTMATISNSATSRRCCDPGSLWGFLYSVKGFVSQLVFRHRVIAALRKRIASQHAPRGQGSAVPESVTDHRFRRVFGAGRNVSACGREQW